jgi:sterol desaturase/sphingolipid hydroxylase (fatty acid hydroxylase superfamily)
MISVNPFYFFLNPSSLFYWPYLISSLFIVCLVLLYAEKNTLRTGRVEGKVFSSMGRDVAFFAMNSVLALFVLTPNLPGFMQGIESFVVSSLQDIFIRSDLQKPTNYTYTFYTFSSVLAYDLAFFLVHLLAHKNRFFWHFHRVHHRVNVLTPLTVFRIHPFEMLCMATITSASVALVYGVFKFCWPNQLILINVWGVNGFLFLFYVSGYHLRHSSVHFSYGPIIERILISPAQHQIHHSSAPEHQHKNMGLIFSVWDGLFGTLYFANKRQVLEFGLTKK